MKSVYQASPLKRKRRTNAELDALLHKVLEILRHESGRITIRHLFYLLVSKGVIDKTEREYDRLGAMLSKWRRRRLVPYTAFSDNTRWWLRPSLHDDAEDALSNTVATYRKNLWATQDHYVELWCEKDAIASILSDVAAPWGVAVFPLRGFASLSSLHSAAVSFSQQAENGKTVCIYYFGDHDPSGVDIDRSALQTLEEDFGVEILFERVAVTRKQIADLGLPTRPTKTSDTRGKNFEGESVEVDAIPPAELRRIAELCITKYVNDDEWEKLQQVEALERASLREVIRQFRAGGAA